MTKKVMLFLLLTIYPVVLGMAESRLSADAIVGQWMVEEQDCLIEIYKKGDKFYGKIVWLKDPYNDQGELARDKENPDPALQSRTILGLELIYGFEFKEQSWENGRIYSPRNGKTYFCRLSLTGEGKLKLRGSLDKTGMLGKTEIWTKQE